MSKLGDYRSKMYAPWTVEISDDDVQLLMYLSEWQDMADRPRAPFIKLGLGARAAYAGDLDYSGATPHDKYNLMYNIGNTILSRLTQSIPGMKVSSRTDEVDVEALSEQIQNFTDEVCDASDMELLWVDANTTFIFFEGAWFYTNFEDPANVRIEEKWFPDVWCDPVARAGRIDELARFVIFKDIVSRSQMQEDYNLSDEQMADISPADKRESAYINRGEFRHYPDMNYQPPPETSVASSFLEFRTPGSNKILADDDAAMLSYDNQYECERYTAFIRNRGESAKTHPWRKVVYIKDRKILKNENYEYQQCPLELMSNNRIGGQLYAIPIWKYIAPFQQAVNFWVYKICRHMDFIGDPILAVDQADDPAYKARTKAKDTATKPFLNRVWRILSFVGKMAPQWLKMPEVSEQIYTYVDKIIYRCEKVIGISDIIQGIGKQQGQRTAFEVQTLLQEASPRIQLTGKSGVYALKKIQRKLAEYVVVANGGEWNKQTLAALKIDSYLQETSSTFKRAKLQDFIETLTPLQTALANPAAPTKYASVVVEIAAAISDNEGMLKTMQDKYDEAMANPSAGTEGGSGMAAAPVAAPPVTQQPPANTNGQAPLTPFSLAMLRRGLK
jgi:hypothetical protein